jgi:glycosyltransferase involved in cell wall biosynthesis
VSVLFLIQGPRQVASSRTRAFGYLPHLSERGVETEVLVWNSDGFVAAQQRGAVSIWGHAANAIRHAAIALRAVVTVRRHAAVYVQKVVLPRWLLRLLKRGGRRLVFDYDDALYALAPGEDRGVRSLLRRVRTRRFTGCLAEADLVVIENDPNRQVTERFCPRTITITGPIDTDLYRPSARPPAEEVVLGWIGSPSTTSYLNLIAPAIRAVASRRRVALHLIGARPFEIPGVMVRHFTWTLDTEVRDLAAFDIGLMPLTDDPWSRGKGGYKILQYMALGIPTVASPVGINVDLVTDGETGLLAADERQWTEALDRLVSDAPLRTALGRRARAEAVARFSLAHYAPIFVDHLLPSGAHPAAALRIEGVRP